jgi:Lrp/AsnC family transcriptional regulator, leucine-responsive regulatory protein
VEQIEEILDQFLLYGQTISSIVVATPVPPRPLPVSP